MITYAIVCSSPPFTHIALYSPQSSGLIPFFQSILIFDYIVSSVVNFLMEFLIETYPILLSRKSYSSCLLLFFPFLWCVTYLQNHFIMIITINIIIITVSLIIYLYSNICEFEIYCERDIFVVYALINIFIIDIINNYNEISIIWWWKFLYFFHVEINIIDFNISSIGYNRIQNVLYTGGFGR